ncbi:sensor histidine kinase [Roseovarius sp. SK2]|jgi:Na+/proline symporter/signal transduction histidine kinase|uniref:sensor histidine kinase n=1 Tax=Roseovarius TaxID=74030 RepID=UPI000CDCE093|nr:MULTISPECIES: sensor histidine kinase [Roseovarius]MDD9727383.1 sensor histidine kinase [Roseovarius sp. SK2]
MGALNVIVLVSLVYVAMLFCVAFAADRAAARGRGTWLRSPIVYTLSLSIYCTAWTFYGAVGFAARSGLEYLTIYLGPTLVMVGWWWTLRKMVRVGRSQRITSIADLISSRFGKSNALAVFVTVLAVIASTPYIALQLQSVTISFAAFAAVDPTHTGEISETGVALWVAIGLMVFTILFGTRNLDANERHHGLVMAIALEAVVKLCALLAVGIFVVWGLAGGVEQTLARIDQSAIARWEVPGSRWVGLTLLSAAAFMCLPRMFQVMVVENEEEGHLRTASWAFPTYVMLMSLFVVPIAAVGLDLSPAGANPDLFVLTLPLENGQEGLAVLSFLGGFSSATSMVIVAAIALSTMVSNHVVMPVWLHMTGGSAVVSGDVRAVAIRARRLSIMVILFLGYLYFRVSGGGAALAAIGLISFVGVAQFLPALLGGLFWRGANRRGALAGLAVGFAVWMYSLFLPSFGASAVMPQGVLENGLLGLAWLRPQALFGAAGMDPVVHAFMWSLSLNIVVFVFVSLISFPQPVERLQGAQFVNVFDHSAPSGGWTGGLVQSEDLMIMAQRIMGAQEAQALFGEVAREQGMSGYLPEPTPDFLSRLERSLAGSVGAATAHAMISQIVGGASVSVQDLMAVADETAQIMEYSSQLEMKTEEQARTARQLRQVNEKLTQISVQKDAFLSQISHELRTPMTSIRAFSEILRDGGEMPPEGQRRYASIIHDEAIRLTRLLDDLLDLSVLENAQIVLNLEEGNLGALLDRAETAAGLSDNSMTVGRDAGADQVRLYTDTNRLAQVFINLMSNARKYCDADAPRLDIRVAERDGMLLVDFIDNGSGIPAGQQGTIFEKFSRVSENKAGGAGLGLAICREIMARLGGGVEYLPGQTGGAFRVYLPVAEAGAAEAAQ